MDKALKPTKADLDGLKAAGDALLAASKKTVALCGELATDDKASPQSAAPRGESIEEIIASCDRYQKEKRRALYSSHGYHVGYDEGRAEATQELQPKIDALEAQVKDLQAQLDKGPERNDGAIIRQQRKSGETPKPGKTEL